MIYNFHKRYSPDSIIQKDVAMHLSNIRNIVRILIEANTLNKRDSKISHKTSKVPYDEIKERLNAVIEENMHAKLGVVNF